MRWCYALVLRIGAVCWWCLSVLRSAGRARVYGSRDGALRLTIPRRTHPAAALVLVLCVGAVCWCCLSVLRSAGRARVYGSRDGALRLTIPRRTHPATALVLVLCVSDSLGCGGCYCFAEWRYKE